VHYFSTGFDFVTGTNAQIKYFTGESNDIDGNGTADFSIENSRSSYSGGDYIYHVHQGTFTPQDELQIQFGTPNSWRIIVWLNLTISEIP
jgi:hypothetical protein